MLSKKLILFPNFMSFLREKQTICDVITQEANVT